MAKFLLVALVVAAPVVTGVVGYYFGGRQNQAAEPTANAVWTDQEIRFSGTTGLGSIRCTYHRADGTTKVTETVVVLTTGANSPRCAAAP